MRCIFSSDGESNKILAASVVAAALASRSGHLVAGLVEPVIIILSSESASLLSYNLCMLQIAHEF